MSNNINDFVIRFANVNGSGSASANGMFAKALFRMGIPVATRNIFPSNIQGLPTWFEVRVSEKGYLGRREGVDIMVAMNAETFAEDIDSILPGGYLLYDNSKPLAKEFVRQDIHEIGIPIATMLLPEFADPKQRSLFKNITYLGALAALLNIEFEVITGMVSTQYKGKDALIEPNIRALELGRNYALEYLSAPLPLQVRRSDAVGDRIMMEGNDAAGLGASTVALPCVPGTRSHLRPRSQRVLKITVKSYGSIHRPGRRITPLCRPRTNWLRLVS